MKIIQILFKSSKCIVITSLEEIAQDCESNPTELEIMRALKEMERDNEIAIISFGKKH
jgi:hypothetical protein